MYGTLFSGLKKIDAVPRISFTFGFDIKKSGKNLKYSHFVDSLGFPFFGQLYYFAPFFLEMEIKIFLSNRCVFLPDVCQLSLRKNDVRSREFFEKFFCQNGQNDHKDQYGQKGQIFQNGQTGLNDQNGQKSQNGQKNPKMPRLSRLPRFEIAKISEIVEIAKIVETEIVRFLETFKIWVFFGKIDGLFEKKA